LALDVPVLLIIFRRPEATRLCLEAIGKAKPKHLLVAADGPRNAEEAIRCEQARALVSEVTWECEIHRNFSERNMGCGVRVYTAIDWALSQYEEIIVLEDDCIPQPAFFKFAASLLERYRSDERIMHISGNNFQNVPSGSPYSYYFSKYTHAWGWATWRRAWRHFDWRLTLWPQFKETGGLAGWCADSLERQYWESIFDSVYGGALDIWDYQWNASCWMQNGLAVLPDVNLVSNIGFGDDATHTKQRSQFLERQVFDLHEIRHPPIVVRNVIADAITFDSNFGGAALRRAASWQARVANSAATLLAPIRALRRLARALVG